MVEPFEGRAWHRLTPQATVAALVVVFATTFAVITPPAQPPDELEHWERVWQLSQGVVVATDYGGAVPRSLVDCAARFDPLRYHGDRHTTVSAMWQEYGRPLQAEVTVHRRFAPQTTYSPLPYLPQAIATAIGARLRAPPIVLLQLGRIANGLGYALVCWAAVRATPVLKWATCMILAAPLPLFLAGSVSVDPLTIAFTTLASALMLRLLLAPAGEVIGSGTLAGVAASLLAVALCKSAYFPVCGMLLVVPTSSWGSRRRRWCLTGGIIALVVLAVWGWAELTVPLHASFWGYDPGAGIAWVAAHPFTFAGVLLNTLWTSGTFLIYCAVGNLGCLDTPLSIQSLDAFFLGLLWVVLNYDAPISVSFRPRAAAACAVVASTLLFSAFVYVQMNAAGSSTIMNMQGRYFLPLGLLICLLLQRRGRYTIAPHWLAAGMTLLSAYSVCVAAARYY